MLCCTSIFYPLYLHRINAISFDPLNDENGERRVEWAEQPRHAILRTNEDTRVKNKRLYTKTNFFNTKLITTPYLGDGERWSFEAEAEPVRREEIV